MLFTYWAMFSMSYMHSMYSHFNHLFRHAALPLCPFFLPDINGIEPEIVVPTGPFKSVGLSKAAQTHRLRKLRSPAKCRQCDSYVYFQGAECEEVSTVLLTEQMSSGSVFFFFFCSLKQTRAGYAWLYQSDYLGSSVLTGEWVCWHTVYKIIW